jgi:hypothetical protein
MKGTMNVQEPDDRTNRHNGKSTCHPKRFAINSTALKSNQNSQLPFLPAFERICSTLRSNRQGRCSIPQVFPWRAMNQSLPLVPQGSTNLKHEIELAHHSKVRRARVMKMPFKFGHNTIL